MPDIMHQFRIKGSTEQVWDVISTARGLNIWWSCKASGDSGKGEIMKLHFGEGYDWKAQIIIYEKLHHIEYEILEADDDWKGAKIGFQLKQNKENCEVEFYHIGWKEYSDHYRISSYCWAMYLRLIKRYVEYGEITDYGNRLEV